MLWVIIYVHTKKNMYICMYPGILYICCSPSQEWVYVSLCMHTNDECMRACVNLCVYLCVCLLALLECTLFCFDTSAILLVSTIYCIRASWGAYMHQMCMCLYVFIRHGLCSYTYDFVSTCASVIFAGPAVGTQSVCVCVRACVCGCSLGVHYARFPAGDLPMMSIA